MVGERELHRLYIAHYVNGQSQELGWFHIGIVILLDAFMHNRAHNIHVLCSHVMLAVLLAIYAHCTLQMRRRGGTTGTLERPVCVAVYWRKVGLMQTIYCHRPPATPSRNNSLPTLQGNFAIFL